MKKNEKRFEIIEDKSTLSFILRQTDDTFITEIDIWCTDEDEFDELSYNTQGDWLNYIRTEQLTARTDIKRRIT